MHEACVSFRCWGVTALGSATCVPCSTQNLPGTCTLCVGAFDDCQCLKEVCSVDYIEGLDCTRPGQEASLLSCTHVLPRAGFAQKGALLKVASTRRASPNPPPSPSLPHDRMHPSCPVPMGCFYVFVSLPFPESSVLPLAPHLGSHRRQSARQERAFCGPHNTALGICLASGLGGGVLKLEFSGEFYALLSCLGSGIRGPQFPGP